MREFNAYCKYCGKTVLGKTTAISLLDSGNYLYIGECMVCLYEVRRIVQPKNHHGIKQNQPTILGNTYD